jgi:phenylacetate-CoA ligase
MTREAEQMDREELAQLQLERLQATLTRVYKNVKFYKKKFDAMGFLPEDCLALEDLRRLPFTTRHDLARAYPYEMFAVPLREVVRIHSSTGSPGNPIVMGYTARDLKNWAKLAARVLTAAGVDRDDVVQVTLSYGLLTSAFGLHYGVELLGASVIPTGPGGTARQVQIMRDYRTTVLISTPSYALIIADQLEKSGMDAKDLFLKVGLLAGEPWTEEQRADIESRLFLTALDNYALSEAMGPGVAGECRHRLGMHLNEDHFLAEIIDPATGSVLPPGDTGASWSSPPSAGRPPRWCASAPATSPPSILPPAPAAAPWPASAASPAGPTTWWWSRASTSSRSGWGRSWPRFPGRSPPTSWSWARKVTWTFWRSGSKWGKACFSTK